MMNSLWRQALPLMATAGFGNQLRLLSIEGLEQDSTMDLGQGVPFPIPGQRLQLSSETDQFLLPKRSLPRKL